MICGGPRTGKTTLGVRLAAEVAERLATECTLLCTDSVMHLGWGNDSIEVATWFLQPGPWVIEGTATVRALRKWFKTAPTLPPCDRVIYLQQPHVELAPRQQGMAKGVETIWRDVLPSLQAAHIAVGSVWP